MLFSSMSGPAQFLNDRQMPMYVAIRLGFREFLGIESNWLIATKLLIIYLIYFCLLYILNLLNLHLMDFTSEL